MTNKEAIKWLREAEILDLASGNTKDREALSMAISALQAQEIRDLLPVSPLLDKKKKKRKREKISALQAQEAKHSKESSLTQKKLDTISRRKAINTVKNHYRVDNDLLEVIVYQLENLPSAQPEWNNHTVACLLAELFDDTCACNYNGIDEWLPRKCELLDSCPNPVGVACWEQYLKHRAERRADGSD